MTSFILIIHFLYINISKEGNSNWDNAYERNEKRVKNLDAPKLDMSEDESNKLKDKTEKRRDNTNIESKNFIYK